MSASSFDPHPIQSIRVQLIQLFFASISFVLITLHGYLASTRSHVHQVHSLRRIYCHLTFPRQSSRQLWPTDFYSPQIGAGHYRYPPYISMEPTTLGIRSRRWRDAVGYRGIPKQIARLQRVVMGRDAWCANTSFSGRSATSVAIHLLCFLDRVLARVSSPYGFLSQTL